MKFGDYIRYYYETYRKPYQQRNTQEVFQSVLNVHIYSSHLADIELDALTLKDLQIFLTSELMHGNRMKLKYYERTGQALAPSTMKRIRQLLVGACRQAVKEGLISRNLAEDTQPIVIKRHNAPVFTPEMQRKFLLKTKSHRFHLAYVLLFYLGCRRSEILGLCWNAIDMRRNLLRIEQVLIIEDDKPVLRRRTKTEASMRTIPFPAEIKYMLQEWRAKQKEESQAVDGYRNENNLVFTNKDGSPHDPRKFSKNFKKTIQRLDFCSNDLHVHSTRHTWASNMIQCGIAITDIQSIGGWSRADTLLNIYAHTVKESQRKAIKKLYASLSSD